MASFIRQPSTTIPFLTRAFSTTRITSARSSKDALALAHSDVPPYPHGPSLIYRQSNFGLYGTAKIRFGNSVSEKNEIKNRRKWKPNVQRKVLHSEALGEDIKIRLTTSVLRTIEKCGGLDEYLLGEKASRIRELGMEGWRLRWRLMGTRKVRERYRVQRAEMGLEETEVVLKDGTVTTREKIDEEFKVKKLREVKEKAAAKRVEKKRESKERTEREDDMGLRRVVLE